MKKLLSSLALVALCGLTLPSALAVPTLTVGVNGGPATDAFTTSAQPGQLLIATSLPDGFTLVIASGLTAPLIGSPTAPNLDLSGQIVYTGNGPGSITICLTGDMFTNTGSLLAALGGTMTPGSATISGTVFVNNVVIGNIPALTETAFADTETVTPFAGTTIPFLLEECITINFNGPGIISFDFQITPAPVPDGGSTAALLGAGLLALGAAAWLREKATA